jgi:broad specificity phosphatase PhoE
MEFPRAWATFCESKTKRGLRCAGEGGESVDDVLRRVRECIEDAVRSVLEEEEEEEEESSGDATIAVVTHAGVLLLLREYLVDEDLSGEKNRGIVRNCSIGTMRVEVDTSSSESKSTTRWILDSWGKVDAEGTADVL